ncbi:hypothetical protein TNCV_848941 [Trichonephila clavipes]|uniref:Uncharacterized protein n=1 Tax=Trichonephila clavipes TaxID=2585209 RepID=A0A8X6RMM2_TRICX|nr:hypothetical protein TNCV_848941 [Trichonephila clavipes]
MYTDPISWNKTVESRKLGTRSTRLTLPPPHRLKIPSDTGQDILSEAEIIAAVTVNEKMSENDKDVNAEDTLQTTKISRIK